MSVDELLTFLKDNQKKLIQKLKDGKYKPNPVRRVEIPKKTKGKIRKLGIPTVVDRVFQQAITQVSKFKSPQLHSPKSLNLSKINRLRDFLFYKI
jgi:retron-type reverse transcriptase